MRHPANARPTYEDPTLPLGVACRGRARNAFGRSARHRSRWQPSLGRVRRTCRIHRSSRGSCRSWRRRAFLRRTASGPRRSASAAGWHRERRGRSPDRNGRPPRCWPACRAASRPGPARDGKSGNALPESAARPIRSQQRERIGSLGLVVRPRAIRVCPASRTWPLLILGLCGGLWEPDC